MKPKRTISAYVLLAGIMGLSIVGGVLAFQIFLAVTKSQVTTEQGSLIKSLDGRIDQKIMENLRTRRKFSSTELSASPISSSGGNIVVVPVALPSASPSAETQ